MNGLCSPFSFSFLPFQLLCLSKGFLRYNLQLKIILQSFNTILRTFKIQSNSFIPQSVHHLIITMVPILIECKIFTIKNILLENHIYNLQNEITESSLHFVQRGSEKSSLLVSQETTQTGPRTELPSIGFDDGHDPSSYSSTEYRSHIMLCISPRYEINNKNI